MKGYIVHTCPFGFRQNKSSYFRVKLKRLNFSCKLNQTRTRPDLDLTYVSLLES